jgi:hypothetical protein
MSVNRYNELSGVQFKALSDALRSTFRLSQFDRMLREQINLERENIALGDDYQEIVFRVIDTANRSGWVYRLVDAAREERPGHPVFVEYAQILRIGMHGLPGKAQLESLITRSNSLLDVAIFRSRLGEVEGRVCRIDLAGDGIGTGFLVGPEIVMTNYHVVEGLVKKMHGPENIACRFDYKVREDGTVLNQGTVLGVAALLSYSPYDPVDLVESTAEPSPDNLDYALLRLQGQPGSEPIHYSSTDPDIPARGWIKVRSVSNGNYAPKSPLFIVQHPAKKPMKVALDTEAVTGLNGNGTRIRYTTNTEPGSSGSPCFNQNWELVALHHSGDQNWVPTWNEGIPINLIIDQLTAYTSLVQSDRLAPE